MHNKIRNRFKATIFSIKEVFRDIVKNHLFVFICGFIALSYCFICIIYKTSPTLNISAKKQPLGEFAYNVCISIIAAVIFYIFQIYIANMRKNKILSRIMRKKFKETLIKQCNLLICQINLIRNGHKSEDEIISAISESCQKIYYTSEHILEHYITIMPIELAEIISDITSNDMLYELSTRSSGSLQNLTLEQIASNDRLYAQLILLQKKLSAEIENM